MIFYDECMSVFVPFYLVFHTGVFVHSQCPDGWVPHYSSCYRLRNDTETWIDALVRKDDQRQ